MTHKRFILLTFVGLTFFQLSCTRDSGEELLYSPDLKMPIVTGLFLLTSPDSPEVLSVWGNPSGNPFCHPTVGTSTNVMFSVNEITIVKIWVVPARSPKQRQTEIYNKLNGYYLNASGLSVATLLNEEKNPGVHQIQFDFKNSHGNLLPEGFYRIYKQQGEWLTWCDVFNYHWDNSENGYNALINTLRRIL